ncbi:MAG TPA: hypothetical protein VKY66_02775, partial [Protaetiibacter sp.]|nr:hypothetical protein [Protaetiibacter sp.]
MESEPTTPTTMNRRPSGSSARRGSASASARARSGAKRIDPPRPEAAVAAEEAAKEAVAADAAPEEATLDEATLEEATLDETTAEAPADTAPADDTAEASTTSVLVQKPRPERKRKPVRITAPESPAAEPVDIEVALSVEGLSKYFGGAAAVDGIDLEVAPGS